MKMKRIITLGLLLSALFSWGQKEASNFPILLKNETVRPADLGPGEATVYNGYRYLIVQHPELVLKQDFYGFETFEYLPKHSAFARVPESSYEAARQKLVDAGGITLNIQKEWKLSPRMFQNNYPEWAWLDNKNMKVWLRYWPQVSHEEAMMALRAKSYDIIDEKPSEGEIALSFNPENIEELQDLSYVMYIQEMEDPGEPENFTARTNHRTSALQQPFQGGLDFDGSNVVIGHNDAGRLAAHIDYTGRLTQVPGGQGGSDHGDHTAGTIFGAGNLDPRGEGMAPGSEMYYDRYPRNLNNADQIYVNQNARLTSNSFSNGCNAGYTSFTRQMDEDAQDNPNMLHVFSAGNDGRSDCSYGAGAGWGNVTGGHKQAKNVITVANFTRTDALANSSSRGPASDGRIKPDIGGVGTSVYSTTDQPQVNSYDSKTGTSMSCPGITGNLAILMQAFKEHNNGQEPNAALLKGMLLNGADDLGNPGPDFRHGYGRVNARRSYQMIENGQFFHDSLSTGDSTSFSISVPSNTAELKVMLIWADPAASTSASRALINDLDLKVDDGSQTLQPWVLDPNPDPSDLIKDAVRARDTLNNIEQVTLKNPNSGNHTLKVKGHNVPSGTQDFYVVYYYEEDEMVITYPQPESALPTGASEFIRWDVPETNQDFTMDYSTDGGDNWVTINSSISSSIRYASLVIPGITSDDVYLRVSNSQYSDEVGPITVSQTPSILQVDTACPDSMVLSWNATNQASGYVVYKLGAKYMDSIAYSTTNSIKMAHDPAQEEWYAVATVLNDTSIGFRSVAVQKEAGVRNCDLEHDLALTRVIAPGQGDVPYCASGNPNLPVIVEIANRGSQSAYNYDIGFQRSGAGANVETISDTLAPGATTTYEFQNSTANLLSNINLNYSFWVSDQQDENSYNDSLKMTIQAYTPSVSYSASDFPYIENFESFSTCSTDGNCEATVCNLRNGWRNAQNGSSDDIDWRVNQGQTPSDNTGPSADFMPGSPAGQYLYLEATGGCDSAEAQLLTPCFDLNGTIAPTATIGYHLLGGDQGTLVADVWDGDQWHLGVSDTISGNQGPVWDTLHVDLSAFVGDIITIRFRGKTGDGFESDVAVDGFTIEENSMSVTENKLQNFRVFPNPSHGLYRIETVGNDLGGAEISITTLSGAKLMEKSFSEEELQNGQQLNLTDQPAGMYMMKISSKSGVHTLRLVKQ